MEDENVIYCEWIGLGNPREIEMPLEEAMKRYQAKENALEGYIFKDTSFIGIKTKDGKWIAKNTD